MTATTLTHWEQKKLFRIKLLFFGTIITFVIQFILPIDPTQQAWPIMRWDMFAFETKPPVETGSLTSYEIVAYDDTGQAHHLPLGELYTTAHIPSSAAIAESVLAFTKQTIDLDVQSQTRHAVLQRLSYLTRSEIVEAEIWWQRYDYDMSKQQYPDMETPSRAGLFFRLTYDETIPVDTNVD